MQKIIVIGANGQLGTDICNVFKHYNVVPLTHNQVEVSSFDSCQINIQSYAPDVIINTSAFHNVEQCENDPITAYRVNALGPRNLAIIAKKIKAVLVHISTDYVFDGYTNQPYQEHDLPLPLNVYGITKLAGEHFIQSIFDEYYIFRTSALYGDAICRGKNAPNFVDRMIELSKTKEKLRVVDNEIVSPTSTCCLAKQIDKAISTGLTGLYHATSQGSCSWYQFTKQIFDIMEIKTPLEKAGPDEFPVKVPRPLYSVLHNTMLQQSCMDIMPSWENSLKDYLNKKKNI